MLNYQRVQHSEISPLPQENGDFTTRNGDLMVNNGEEWDGLKGLKTLKHSQPGSTLLYSYVSNPLVGTTKRNIVSGPASLLVNLNVSIVVGMEDCHDLVPSDAQRCPALTSRAFFKAIRVESSNSSI